ncbi:Coiled-coil domain-containing protein SCD2 [Bienertia sinuspersici]
MLQFVCFFFLVNMDRFKSRFDRQKSIETATDDASPMAGSPNRHARSASHGVTNNMKKPQNVAAKAAAQRLAQVMASSGDDDDDGEEDDLIVDYKPVGSLGGLGRATGRPTKPRSPKPMRTASAEQTTSLRNPPSARPSSSNKTNEQPLPRPSSAGRPSQPPINSLEPTQSSAHLVSIVKSPRSSTETIDMAEEHNSLSGRPSLSVKTNEEPSGRTDSAFRTSSSTNNTEQPTSVQSASGGRSHMSVNSEDLNPPGRSPKVTTQSEQPPSARSTPSGRPTGIKTGSIVPPAVKLSLKQQAASSPAAGNISNKRLSLEFGSMISREPKEPNDQLSSTALQDEVDMLQEENDSLTDKLRLAEERFQESEARVKHLEKQVNFDVEVVTEVKEAVLQQKEAALRAASQKYGGKTGEITALRMEAEAARDEATSALDQLQESESELRTLRSMVQRLMLTQEEMEEVVLKRCWLARYWGLCVQYGIYPDIAETKLEYWSSLAPLPVEIVIAAGQKAKEDSFSAHNGDRREKTFHDASELSGEGSAENMLIVERGLRELAVLKVEDAVRLAVAQHRRKNMQKPAFTDDLRSPSQKFGEAFDLSHEESEEVQFKQAWLMYFWRRARDHGVEPDIADERLRFLDQP